MAEPKTRASARSTSPPLNAAQGALANVGLRGASGTNRGGPPMTNPQPPVDSRSFTPPSPSAPAPSATQTPAQLARAAAEQFVLGKAPDWANAVLQGASQNLADEGVAAALASTINDRNHDLYLRNQPVPFSAGDAYKAMMDLQQERRDKYHHDRPVVSRGLELAGSLPLALIPGLGEEAIGKTAAQMGMAALQGAIAGAGSERGPDRLGGAATGVVVGVGANRIGAKLNELAPVVGEAQGDLPKVIKILRLQQTPERIASGRPATVAIKTPVTPRSLVGGPEPWTPKDVLQEISSPDGPPKPAVPAAVKLGQLLNAIGRSAPEQAMPLGLDLLTDKYKTAPSPPPPARRGASPRQEKPHAP